MRLAAGFVDWHFVLRLASNAMCAMLTRIRLAKPNVFVTQAQFRRSRQNRAVHIACGMRPDFVVSVLPRFATNTSGHALSLASSVT